MSEITLKSDKLSFISAFFVKLAESGYDSDDDSFWQLYDAFVEDESFYDNAPRDKEHFIVLLEESIRYVRDAQRLTDQVERMCEHIEHIGSQHQAVYQASFKARSVIDTLWVDHLFTNYIQEAEKLLEYVKNNKTHAE